MITSLFNKFDNDNIRDGFISKEEFNNVFDEYNKTKSVEEKIDLNELYNLIDISCDGEID